MKDFVRNVADGVRERNRALFEDEFFNGFEGAANICLSVLSESIAEIKSKPGGKSSTQEQLLLLKLYEIKDEIEARLRDFPANQRNT
ncbi:hypothetical protein [Micromonospora sp. NPDC050200]|uniref:hypothetical protein n=1 Tax=Micromonospora sp. NPDC050200 TaxID=3155664 RepID=UPI0033CDB95B